MLDKDNDRRFIVRESWSEDGYRMLRLARQADRKEWDASVLGGLTEHLVSSISFSKTHGEAITVEDTETGQPMMIGGAHPGDQGQVLTWLVLAEGCEQWGLAFMKDYREDLDGFFSRWPKTECFSDSRNLVHHRWLEFLGYQFRQEVLWGPYDLPFIHYRKGF